jgi:hypothetical protein
MVLPASSSNAYRTGATISAVTLDYFAVARTAPYSIGALGVLGLRPPAPPTNVRIIR